MAARVRANDALKPLLGAPGDQSLCIRFDELGIPEQADVIDGAENVPSRFTTTRNEVIPALKLPATPDEGLPVRYSPDRRSRFQ
jgi:hypothetical protein